MQGYINLFREKTYDWKKTFLWRHKFVHRDPPGKIQKRKGGGRGGGPGGESHAGAGMRWKKSARSARGSPGRRGIGKG